MTKLQTKWIEKQQNASTHQTPNCSRSQPGVRVGRREKSRFLDGWYSKVAFDALAEKLALIVKVQYMVDTSEIARELKDEYGFLLKYIGQLSRDLLRTHIYPRTLKPLTFSKNRFREAKNRSNTSPIAKFFFRKNDFFFKFLHMCNFFFYISSFCFKYLIFFLKIFYRSFLNTFKRFWEKKAPKKSCIYGSKVGFLKLVMVWEEKLENRFIDKWVFF
ncbi:hypothetical protein LXL04_029676 [Taraxacum kok-saghyz]